MPRGRPPQMLGRAPCRGQAASLSPASVESSVLLCLLVPHPVPSRGLPAFLSLLPHHPPLEPGGVDYGPSLNLDWNLLSRTRASTLAKNRGTEPPGEPGSPCPWPVNRVTHRHPGGRGRYPTASWVGGFFMFSFLIPKKQLTVPLSTEVGEPGICPFTWQVRRRAFPL